MDKIKSLLSTRKSSGAKGAVGQEFLLIWLDSNIDTRTKYSQNIVTQLDSVIHNVKISTDNGHCLQLIQSMTDDKICMVVSGTLGEQIVPRVHNMSQVYAIFVFCANKTRHEQWAKDWSKIKAVCTDVDSICHVLRKVIQESEQNTFITTNENLTHKTINKLDSSYMYTQILKEILLTITFSEEHMKEFIYCCREQFRKNNHELDNIARFEREYHKKSPLWWYTCECFLYPMVNRALRLMDVDMIIKMGFFIADLDRQIQQLYCTQLNKNQFNKHFMVYRGQGMSKEDFEQLKKNEGGLMSFNNFLFTSMNYNDCLKFAKRAMNTPDLVGIQFAMSINPSRSSVSFASVKDVSYYNDSDDIIFSMNTVFRIHTIKSIDKNNRLFQVDMELTSDTDKDIQLLGDRIREEISLDQNEWCKLGHLLCKMGKSDKARKIYETLLEQTNDDTEKGYIYEQIGLVKYNQGEYDEALKFYKKSLEIQQKYLPPNHPNLALCYKRIGLVHNNMRKYAKALSSYEKALEIQQNSLSANHPDLASSYSDIGKVYNDMEEYSKALSYYEKAVEIQQKSLPSNHPNLASSYGNIGSVYENLKKFPKARSFYERAVDIGQKSLPSDHPNLQQWKDNLEYIKKKL
ncbi:unnamed protein product [Adineta steineri]|uniref:Uncharacterized protein n=1 Tax=Adineta steineri TaxID=433720 RepID=A0A815HSP4_9BILA|nr:unnamed protein product [Adineta steineri]